MIGNLDQSALHDPVHDPHIPCKASTGRLKAGRAAYLFVNRTLGKSFLAAVVAIGAGNVMEDSHPVAHGKGLNPLPHCGNRAHGLMAKDAGCGVRSSMDFLEVGTADAAAVYPYEHFSRSNRRHSNGLNPDVVHSAIDSGLHGRRNGKWA